MNIIRSTCLTLAIIFRQQRGYRPGYRREKKENCNKMLRQRWNEQNAAWVTEIYPQQNNVLAEYLQYKHCKYEAKTIFVTVVRGMQTMLIGISFIVVVLLLWLTQGSNMAGISHLWGRVHYFKMRRWVSDSRKVFSCGQTWKWKKQSWKWDRCFCASVLNTCGLLFFFIKRTGNRKNKPCW